MQILWVYFSQIHRVENTSWYMSIKYKNYLGEKNISYNKHFRNINNHEQFYNNTENYKIYFWWLYFYEHAKTLFTFQIYWKSTQDATKCVSLVKSDSITGLTTDSCEMTSASCELFEPLDAQRHADLWGHLVVMHEHYSTLLRLTFFTFFFRFSFVIMTIPLLPELN